MATTQAAPIWTPQMTSRYAPAQGSWTQSAWTPVSAGSQIVVPSNGISGHSLSTQGLPVQYLDQPQGPALQQAVEIINPISYQQPAPRGGNRLR